MNATIIEACSCPMFCQCYFNSQPAGGHEGHEGHGAHYCRFSNAVKVNKGSYNDVKLDGVKFWVSGDLGGDFSKGQMDWAIVTFDKAMSQPQRDALELLVAWGDSRTEAQRWLERAGQLHPELEQVEAWVRAAYRIKAGAAS